MPAIALISQSRFAGLPALYFQLTHHRYMKDPEELKLYNLEPYNFVSKALSSKIAYPLRDVVRCVIHLCKERC